MPCRSTRKYTRDVPVIGSIACRCPGAPTSSMLQCMGAKRSLIGRDRSASASACSSPITCDLGLEAWAHPSGRSRSQTVGRMAYTHQPLGLPACRVSLLGEARGVAKKWARCQGRRGPPPPTTWTTRRSVYTHGDRLPPPPTTRTYVYTHGWEYCLRTELPCFCPPTADLCLCRSAILNGPNCGCSGTIILCGSYGDDRTP